VLPFIARTYWRCNNPSLGCQAGCPYPLLIRFLSTVPQAMFRRRFVRGFELTGKKKGRSDPGPSSPAGTCILYFFEIRLAEASSACGEFQASPRVLKPKIANSGDATRFLRPSAFPHSAGQAFALQNWIIRSAPPVGLAVRREASRESGKNRSTVQRPRLQVTACRWSRDERSSRSVRGPPHPSLARRWSFRSGRWSSSQNKRHNSSDPPCLLPEVAILSSDSAIIAA
jgi:hypothetical protein